MRLAKNVLSSNAPRRRFPAFFTGWGEVLAFADRKSSVIRG